MSESTSADGTQRNETATAPAGLSTDDGWKLRWGAYLVALSGVGFVANGAAILYRALFTDGFEAGVDTLGGVTGAELASTNHEVYHYIQHLHVNVAGLMAAAGIGVIALSWFGIRRGQRWALPTAVAIPVVFLAHSVPVHQTAGFSFDTLVHLGPGLLWLPALIAGAVLARQGLARSDG